MVKFEFACDDSLAAKWKKARLRLLFESSTFGKELRNAFRDILKSFHQMQVYDAENC